MHCQLTSWCHCWLVWTVISNHCVKAALVTSFQMWIHNVCYFIWIGELARGEGGRKEDTECKWKSCMCSLRLVTDKPLFPSLAAYFNDIAVGAVCCRVDHSQNQKRLYIMTLGCLAPYRRLGIGKEGLLLYLSHQRNQIAVQLSKCSFRFLTKLVHFRLMISLEGTWGKEYDLLCAHFFPAPQKWTFCSNF